MAFGKKARVIELKEDEKITPKKYYELSSHAKNSSLWYLTNYMKTEKELREKLLAKGYFEASVTVLWPEGAKEHNLIDETIIHLKNILMLDDHHYTVRYAERKKAAKVGPNKVKIDLSFKGIPEIMIEEVLEEVYEDSQDELTAFIEREVRSLASKNLEPWQLRQRLMRKAVVKGWDLDDANEIINSIIQN